MAHRQDAARLFRGPGHGQSVLIRGCHGLFAQHMLAGPESGDGEGSVAAVGGADAHGIHVPPGQQSLQTFTGCGAGSAEPVPELRRPAAEEGPQGHAGHGRQIPGVFPLRRAAAADDADTDLSFHCVTSGDLCPRYHGAAPLSRSYLVSSSI